ncbi:MAG: dehydrogenase, partial [Verrucomicrobia bacterium]|nr:dehydrogenase [Verrucomicrobiota bacterium]
MKDFYLLVLPLYLCVVPSFPAWSQPDVFEAAVRPTEPLTPSDQLKTFHVPQGFQIALVTSEPVIAKPMNMAFDHRGRLWVTTSDAYPWSITPGQENKFKDSIVILDDQDGDGSPEITTTFATGLNIPIGIYPYRDGAIVWSIDNIWNLQDTDQDGVADTKEVLYGPVGKPRDTHGMHNAFRRGYDGQLYINHGFNNDSTISGNDGSQIKLNSGNTYRIRLDGSHVEQFSWGQVNPFGSSFDKFGYLYTADCHSQPIYQIIPQAYYPSFGKPHDGLGFGPMVMQHSHGSTAISGLVIMDDTNWPDEYMDNIFVGNVMTSRINRDQLTYHHASPEAHELPDFLISDDPWFRPVDLQWGPDGALYIADFYNKIIGHYEVDLNHPERDRHRGRIWRVSYHGTEGKTRWNYPSLNLSPSTWSRAVKELESPNRTRRHIALDFLTDQMSDKAVQPLRQLLASNKEYKYSKVMALWG